MHRAQRLKSHCRLDTEKKKKNKKNLDLCGASRTPGESLESSGIRSCHGIMGSAYLGHAIILSNCVSLTVAYMSRAI